MEVVRRFFQFPSGSAFIFGPRGSGKSTWLRHSLPDALWLNLLQPKTYRFAYDPIPPIWLCRTTRTEERVRPSPDRVRAANNRVRPVKNRVCPADNRVRPVKNRVCPADNRVRPVKNRVCPADNRVCPADNRVRPVKNRVCPANNRVVLRTIAFVLRTNAFVRRKTRLSAEKRVCPPKNVSVRRKTRLSAGKRVCSGENAFVFDPPPAPARKQLTDLKHIRSCVLYHRDVL